MRIALTVDPELPVPPLHYGGIERIVDVLARGLEQRGHEVTLFAHRQSSTAGRLVPWPGRASESSIDTARNAAALAMGVVRARFDLVHSFSRVAYMLPLLPCSLPKIMTYQRPISYRSVALAHRLSRGTLQFSAVSHAMIKPVSKIGSWHIVPNGVPLATYDYRSVIDDDAPLVFLGRIEEIKGPHLAIEVARRTGLRLIIAGNIPSEQKGWYEAYVAPHIDGTRVCYVGPVDDACKNLLLGSARALLMPILWEEPFGIVMAEAMACGTPVIGFRRGSVPEVVVEGKTGFVVEDLDGLVEAVNRIGTIDRAAVRARVERLYSDEAVVNGYLEVYSRLTTGKARLQEAA